MKPSPGQRDLFGGGQSALPQYDAAREADVCRCFVVTATERCPVHDAAPLNSTVEEWDAPRLTAAQRRLLKLLCDRQWHTNGELAHVAGYRFSARLEELSKAGWPWAKEHVGGGTWRYRLLARGEGDPR